MTKRLSKARRSRAEWAELVRKWLSSDQTQEQFAREHGVRARTLQWWRWRLGKTPDTAMPIQVGAREMPIEFVELDVASDTPREGPFVLELAMAEGHVLRVRGHVDTEALGCIVAALSGRPQER